MSAKRSPSLGRPDRPLGRRDFLRTTGLVGVGALGWRLGDFDVGIARAAVPSSSSLEVFGAHPRSIWFRKPAGIRLPDLTYEQWKERYLPLNGMLIHVTGDEQPPRSEFAGYANRLKDEHPEKLVLAQWVGRGRDPNFNRDQYFAGHWVYKAGTVLTQPAGPSDTVLHVADTSVFNLPGVSPVVIGITLPAGPDGKIAWLTAEQMNLVATDETAGTITIDRGQYGTQARAWDTGAYLTPHVVYGTLGLWGYNFATTCPTDANGNSCAEVLANELESMFAPGGVLENFDGIEFDVLYWSQEQRGRRANEIDSDVNADGVPDEGVVDGLNVYGLGVGELLSELRSRLPNKILMADGWHIRTEFGDGGVAATQRSFDSLNGIETEGFINGQDFQVDGWSEGINILDYWHARAVGPQLNYVNHKSNDEPPVNFPRTRLVLAAAVFTDSIYAQLRSVRTPDREVGIVDELWKGAEQTTNWLGAPLGPRQRLATSTPDLLDGHGVGWPQKFVDQFQGDDVTFARLNGGGPARMLISSTTPPGIPQLGEEMSFVLPGLNVTGSDLLVSLSLTMDPVEGYPASIARYVRCAAAGKVQAGWSDQDGFAVSFYFKDVGPGTLDIGFEVEGRENVTFNELRVYSAQDVIYREFENGLVLGNPSHQPFTLNLTNLFPGTSFRRLQGSPRQDPDANNGQPVGDTVTLGAIDGLFLIREQ